MKVSFRHQLTIKYSPVIEALSLVCALGNSSDHETVIDLSEFEDIKNKYKNFFDRFRKLPQLRFAWLEFSLLSFERERLEVFIEAIQACSLERQLVTLMGHEIDEDDALKALESLTLISDTQKMVALWGYDESLAEVIESFSKVMDAFYEVLRAIDTHEAFNRTLSELQEKCVYEPLLNQFREGTTARHPLSFAQELMGKPFWNIADYVRYEFIPVHFISPYAMRLMDDATMIYIHALNRRAKTPEAFLESILDPLKSTSDGTRLKILRMLYMHPMYGKEIADTLNLTTATVSHHLEALYQQGLVNVEKVKQIKYFSTNYTRLSRMLDEVTRYIKENK